MRIDIHMYSGSTNALSSRSYPFACPFTLQSAFFFFSKTIKKPKQGLKSGK